MITATLYSVEKQNDTTYTFWLKPSQPIDYTAGQYVEVYLPHEADARGTHRWFTLSSSPSESLIAITTRKVARQSSFKKALFGLHPGDTLHLSQAMGDFVLPMQKSIPIIFLIRGIGITPARSMLQFLKDTGENRPITLIYSLKHTSDALYTDLISTVALQSETQVQPTLIDVEQPVQKTLEYTKKVPNARVYVSGPEQFVEKAYDQLLGGGLKASYIVTDYFHGYKA